MKAKHNKKRNTAFIFETLSHEMTKAIISGEEPKKKKVVSIIKEHFKKGTQLRKELDLYHSLDESCGVQEDVAIRVIQEAKRQHAGISKGKLFSEQSAVINKINKELSKSVFSNFVGNYKYLATISQMFNDEIKIKDRILLENIIVSAMTKEDPSEKMKSVDAIVYKSFVNNFNNEYSQTLAEGQKELLGKYVSSFSDNGLEFKVYMNEEVGRLKEKVRESLVAPEIKTDKEMIDSTKKVYEILENISKKPIDEEIIRNVMNIQNFVSEVES